MMMMMMTTTMMTTITPEDWRVVDAEVGILENAVPRGACTRTRRLRMRRIRSR